ncbi:hypothetical protein HOF92_04735 [bacterium]|jgi:hypothetical protein|nr:hypothetical protein [bacterium]
MWLDSIFQTSNKRASVQALQIRMDSLELELERLRKMNRKLSFTVDLLMRTEMKDLEAGSSSSVSSLQVS